MDGRIVIRIDDALGQWQAQSPAAFLGAIPGLKTVRCRFLERLSGIADILRYRGLVCSYW